MSERNSRVETLLNDIIDDNPPSVAPRSRVEQILTDLINSGSSEVKAQSRIEALLKELDVGGGSTNVLSGTSAPTSEQGSNGMIYLKYFGAITSAITDIRMIITSDFGGSFGVQLSEITLLDSNDSAIVYPSGTTATANFPNYDTTTPAFVIDGSTSTKWLSNGHPSTENPLIITIHLGTPLPVSNINGWAWYSGSDTPARDPRTFVIELSTNNGGTWSQVDAGELNAPAPNRSALAYTANLEIALEAIDATYAKVNGAWQPLIGTDINDINLSNSQEANS